MTLPKRLRYTDVSEVLTRWWDEYLPHRAHGRNVGYIQLSTAFQRENTANLVSNPHYDLDD